MSVRVDVWLLSTVVSPALVEQFSTELPAGEQVRCAGLTDPVAKAEYVLGRLALRRLLADALGRPQSAFTFGTGTHGKPALAGGELEFNLSHSDGLAAIAICERAVGIDVQRQRTGAGLDRMAARYFAPLEASWMQSTVDEDELGRRFSRLWSRKEACLKVTGGRLIPSLVWPLVTFEDASFGWTEPAVTGRDLAVPAGHHGAVAVAGHDSIDLHLSWWSAADPTPNPEPTGVLMAGTSC